MRLSILQGGHKALQKVFLGIIKMLAGRVPGPILVMSYHPQLFGSHFAACLQEGMRGPSEWSVGEREIFSAIVSKLNRCAY
jgi:hypothetical protein